MFVSWLDVDKLKSRLELILMKHEVLIGNTLTYNATYILEDCTLEAKFHHKYRNDRDRELSLVIKLYYFNIKHTMIVWHTDILDGIDSPKNKKKRNNSCGKTKIDDYFRSKYKKESELCIQNLS